MQKPATGANRLTFAAVSKAGACNDLRREPNGLWARHGVCCVQIARLKKANCKQQPAKYVNRRQCARLKRRQRAPSVYDATLDQEISNKSLKLCLVSVVTLLFEKRVHFPFK